MIITIIILTIFFIALMISFIYSLILLKKSVNINEEKSKKILELAEKRKENDISFRVMTNNYVLMDVAHSILLMVLNLYKNNQEKYSFYFNDLYFFGVPKEVLENDEKIMEFHNNCIQNKYIVEEGESPFKYKFVLIEEDEQN
jgi:hypothetical protein